MTAVAANGITIEYESLGDPLAPPILLIMGLGMQLVAWPDAFCRGLIDRGFRVIRFDNRDSGLSSKIRVRRQPNLVAALAAAWLRLPVRAPYTLDAMAADAVGLLDALDVPRAHIVGLSMGGMIAQILAATYPAARAQPDLHHVVERQPEGVAAKARREAGAAEQAARPRRPRERGRSSRRRLRRHRQPGLPHGPRGVARTGHAQCAPRPPSGRRDAATGRDHRVRRPPQAADENHRADTRHPRCGRIRWCPSRPAATPRATSRARS